MIAGKINHWQSTW